MKQPTQIEVDGLRFQISPIPAMKALRLDKRIVTLLIPVISGIEDLDAEIDFSKLAKGVSEGLSTLNDADFETLVRDMLMNVTYLPAGRAPLDLNTDAGIDAFYGDLEKGTISVYKLIVEVMRFNNLSPFGFMGDGGLMNIMPTSAPDGESTKKKATQSAKLGNFTKP